MMLSAMDGPSGTIVVAVHGPNRLIGGTTSGVTVCSELYSVATGFGSSSLSGSLLARSNRSDWGTVISYSDLVSRSLKLQLERSILSNKAIKNIFY